MNKSFKVVFSKARSALMVVNEATSSIQAKGTKTVIAVAAAMVAGGAVAADQATVTIDAGSLTITGAEQNKVEYSASKSGVTTDAKGTVWADADTLADTAKVTFKNNGKLNLTATASGGVTKAVDSLEGTGSLVLTGANGAGAASKDVTLTIGASNAKVALGNSGALTITFANAGTASTDANDNGVATTTVKSNGGDLTLGVVTAAATPGDHNLTKTEGTVTLDAQAGSDGVVSAGTGALTLAINIAIIY